VERIMGAASVPARTLRLEITRRFEIVRIVESPELSSRRYRNCDTAAEFSHEENKDLSKFPRCSCISTCRRVPAGAPPPLERLLVVIGDGLLRRTLARSRTRFERVSSLVRKLGWSIKPRA